MLTSTSRNGTKIIGLKQNGKVLCAQLKMEIKNGKSKQINSIRQPRKLTSPPADELIWKH
jgi:hypothetical protein